MRAQPMARSRDAERTAELRRILDDAAFRYYASGESPLSDAEYDALWQELVAIETAHPRLRTPDSPTLRIGAPLPKGSSLAQVPHLVPMLSLDSLMAPDEARDFDQRARKALGLADDEALRWAVEPKFDGVSASLLYEHGELVRGLSRGDGATGEDVTHNLRTIRNLPLRFHGQGPFPARVEVRGEVIFSKPSFEVLRAHSETSADTPFRNARNTAAGTLKLLDPQVVAKRGLEFIAWGVGHADGLAPPTYAGLHAALAGFGFTVSRWFEVVDGVDGVIRFHDRLEAERDAIPYELDGIVAKVDDADLQRRLGRTARSPRWALAFKFEPRRATTRILGISAQVGRTGAVTPVAELEPVEIAGVTVKRATLHNWELLRARDVRVDDVVEVQRAGDVIPEVVEVHTQKRGKDSRPVEAPSDCPSCRSALECAGAFRYCVNLGCPDQLRGRVVHLASRRALDIEGLGPERVDRLMAAGLIGKLDDVFALPARREAFVALEGFGERSHEKLVAAIEGAKRPSLARFVHALGIRQVGEQTAKDLATAFGDLDRLAAATEEQLLGVHGVGPEVAKSILRFFSLDENRRLLAALAEAGVQPQRNQAVDGPLAGRVFCFTGGLSSMSRDEARQAVEQLGATTAPAVTKAVTDVVAGDKAGSKLDKARKLGLDVLEEDDFVALIRRR